MIHSFSKVVLTVLAGGLLALGVGLTAFYGQYWGMSDRGSSDTEADGPRPSGTVRMADTLEAISERAKSRPMDYYYLNAQRAEVLQSRIEEAPVENQFQLRFRRAHELLNAGQTQSAISALNRLIKDRELDPRRLNRETKPVFGLLAAAYLRLGEQRNCLDNHSGQSCILPIRGAGVHARESGSENAISVYERILQQYPFDLQSRWLYNVAHMTLDQYPGLIPNRFLVPGVEAQSTMDRFPNVASRLGVAHNGLSGGVSMEDFNGDGLLDLLVTSYGIDDQVRYYENDGTGGYVDRTKEADLMGIVSGLNTTHADYNNDGCEDVLILRGAWLGSSGQHPNSLLRNDCDGTFTDVTFQAGLDARHPTQTAAWADVNRDGHIDLFVGNESNQQVNWATGEKGGRLRREHRSMLYLNQGDGTFADGTEQANIELNAYVKGVTWGDVNGDGWPDLYASILNGMNRLYVHQGGSSEDWSFRERSVELGVEDPRYSFTTWFWDYNNDGHQDLFVSGYDMRYLQKMSEPVAAEMLDRPTGAEKPRLYRNDGDGTFTDVTEQVHLDVPLFTMGGNYGDINGDGRQDFYVGTGAPDLRSLVPNRMFVGRDSSFQEVTYAGGFGHIQKGHGVAVGDLDRDGDQDVYSVMGGAFGGDRYRNVLFENPGRGHSWLTLDLVGRTANRSAIGARVMIEVVDPEDGRRTLHRTVSTGGSFGASSLQQEIGLGEATRIARVTVTWPTSDRHRQTFTRVKKNRAYRIVQGQSPTLLKRAPVPFSTGGIANLF